IAAFKTAIEKAPNNAAGYYELGLVYQEQQRSQEAQAAFEQAFALEPDLVDALAQVAALFVARGQVDKALERVHHALQTSPHHPRLYNLLASLLQVQGKNAEAEEAFKKALALDNTLFETYFGLARLYTRTKAYDQAIAQYEGIIKAQPGLLAPYALVGMIYDLQSHVQKANEYYQKALKIDPKFAVAANNLAWNYTEHGGNLDEALALARSAREQMPDSPQVADTLGWIYYKKQEYPKAISLLKESVARRTNDPVIRYHLGMAYYKNGDTGLAKVELQQALHLRPDFPGAQEARAILAALQ
ncbi:MAG: tetratricopeptide repeat protein, partial [candidate division KSB1 bacterium]|nr:tetratricopeptide repeat protein [candidate division KSB1 bacterium]